MHKLLVIEDDAGVADYLRQGLMESGYAVDVARTGPDGHAMAAMGAYEVILLDVMLPGMDGFEVLRRIREHDNTAVLMLTARDRIDDRVKGLSAGADDYLVKPFAFSELQARVAALIRRGHSLLAEQTVLRLSDLEVDLPAHKVRRGGKRIDLTLKEFQLLSLLIRRKGQVLTRTTLAERVWNIHFDTESNMVEVAVRRLRAKIDDAFRLKLLHTIRGVGYVLEDRS
ncbi:response regulator [Pigmentiphaga aceris]|uniref:Response regulator n=1 Tax=Pigmentiphaga aceris TaxID=1940612 RepID=A0A5C0AZG9_9BURK|nr:heavy metal response regulator transcription factor [Pigmentiphaga aceris]QEI05827.1 response regulator [Pigmentiphaga aceris]